MNLNIKRIAILTGLALLPVSAFAAAAATGFDGGLCASLMGSLFGGCAGCPG